MNNRKYLFPKRYFINVRFIFGLTLSRYKQTGAYAINKACFIGIWPFCF